MNNLTKTASYFVTFILGAIVLGGLFYHPRTEIQTVIKEVNSNEVNWRKLKEIDDKGFENAANFAGVCSNIVSGGPYRLDDILLVTTNLQNLARERQSVLKELGY